MRLDRPAGSAAVDLDRVDLADARLYGEGEPHAVWGVLRERQPVRWQPVAGKPGFWAVTNYAAAERVLTDHRVFTSEHVRSTWLAGIKRLPMVAVPRRG
ncbi:hypothetical protein GCM10027280_18160 [Micromonospora polyrhachis]|uniref:Cytochrome P450 n=1 Tax=Micromonospora polyrhachis TaxID=1282883 RepID=A0A7W7WN69_9ACTN|nr:hypothetical protein [Micromonospora polyrhachis]MBB4956913.1 cytochrome P450 [Micromonospora polyrhachis]